jgi:dihydroorotate dehydrogenase
VIYRRLARPLLYRLDPERAHDLAIRTAAIAAPIAGRLPSPLSVRDPRLAQSLMGCTFPTPVGLAAGFDKSGRAVGAWPALGFGFVEIGTVTAHPQPGNPRPRIFRLPADEALVNRLGFNNDGAERVAARLERARRRGLLGHIPLGINIGKSKVTDLDAAPSDYLRSFEALCPYADYVVVNVSSPNTPGLRELQDRDRLAQILRALIASNEERAHGRGGAGVPLLVKLAPDLGLPAVDDVVDLALELEIAGLVVGNTTLARDGLASPQSLTGQEGGLSGRPLRRRSTELIRHIAGRAGGRLVIVGVGGVFSADDAWEKLAVGASLVQVYTGLVYEGPMLARRIARGILRLTNAEGRTSLAEVVGRG